MKPFNTTVLALFSLIVSFASFATDQLPEAQVSFFGSGFTVQAPAGASQVELRVADPQRNEVYRQTTDGGDITWAMSGAEQSGEYRYEAVVVMEVNGQLKQRNSAGGFEVQGGMLIGPPDTAELEARIKALESRVSE